MAMGMFMLTCISVCASMLPGLIVDEGILLVKLQTHHTIYSLIISKVQPMTAGFQDLSGSTHSSAQNCTGLSVITVYCTRVLNSYVLTAKSKSAQSHRNDIRIIENNLVV